MPTAAIFDEQALATVRRAYAVQMLAVAGANDDPRLEDAFAAVPRERYLGLSPWQIARWGGYLALPSANPVLAYQDVLFALSPERGVNNGSPSLHARWLHHARIEPGERVVHLGAGTGYYTALIAHLVGRSGHVTAVEFDRRLATLARDNLAHLSNVTVVEGDAARWPEEDTDCVYVNFSVERPAPAWIDRLNPGGRLIFPLGVPRSDATGRAGQHAVRGAGFSVERRAGDLFAATWLGAAFFVCGEGEMVGSDREHEALNTAFERGGVDFVRSLVWRRPPSAARTWFTGSGWSLSYDEVV